MDDKNPCLSNATVSLSLGVAEPFVPASCPVCSNSTPCLFDVYADPLEESNVAKQNPDIVAKLASMLASYVPYVPDLEQANLNCYNCSFNPGEKWDNYVGPCCIKNTSNLLL